MRLDKFLAQASIGSRKNVRIYVKEGHITVNEFKIIDPAIEIKEDEDIIKYLDKQVQHLGKIYYMFHKPGGCITARKDDNNKTVLEYFNQDNLHGIFPVGRLDKDTEGLLLLTNDGEFNHKLMYPDKHVEKTYYFWAFGALDQSDLDSLQRGICIGEGEALAKAEKVIVEIAGIYEDYQELLSLENTKENRKIAKQQKVVSGYITISEGRKHQVKRMLRKVGCYVIYLKRISIGGLQLDENLKKGEYRELTKQEIELLL